VHKISTLNEGIAERKKEEKKEVVVKGRPIRLVGR